MPQKVYTHQQEEREVLYIDLLYQYSIDYLLQDIMIHSAFQIALSYLEFNWDLPIPLEWLMGFNRPLRIS